MNLFVIKKRKKKDRDIRKLMEMIKKNPKRNTSKHLIKKLSKLSWAGHVRFNQLTMAAREAKLTERYDN